MKTKIASVVGALTCMFVAGVSAQEAARPNRSIEIANTTEPLGGKPAAGAKQSVPDLNYQVAYQRAFEAVIWSVPAVARNGFYRAAMDIGVKDNTILAWSQPAKPNAELLTANNVAPYIFSQTDLRRGPVVVEIPAATDKASLYGQIVDHWQITIADVGPSGLDQGKGGKFLLTPPGYKGAVPAGHTEVKSPSYRVCFVFRSVKGASATTEDASAYAKTLKMYYLDDPRPTAAKGALAGAAGAEVRGQQYGAYDKLSDDVKQEYRQNEAKSAAAAGAAVGAAKQRQQRRQQAHAQEQQAAQTTAAAGSYNQAYKSCLMGRSYSVQ